jgi:hypothetical protein
MPVESGRRAGSGCSTRSRANAGQYPRQGCPRDLKAIITQIYILNPGNIILDAIMLPCANHFHSFINREQILDVWSEDGLIWIILGICVN